MTYSGYIAFLKALYLGTCDTGKGAQLITRFTGAQEMITVPMMRQCQNMSGKKYAS